VGYNTSTVTPRVVGGDEKGSLKSETVKYGRESQWMVTALLGNWPLNTLRSNTRYTTIREVVFSPCRSKPREVKGRAVPSRNAPRSFPRQLRCKHGDDATVLLIAAFSMRSDSKLHDENNRPTELVLRSEFSERFYGEEISQSARSSEVWICEDAKCDWIHENYGR
jgi:hypothetical protein